MPNTELTETPKRKFTIDRSKWRCAGHGNGSTRLLNEENYRCCLGFVSSQCGVPDEDLLNYGSPRSISRREKLKGILLNSSLDSNVLTHQAIVYNDDPSLSDKEREEKLIALFLEHGFVLEFTGEYENA